MPQPLKLADDTTRKPPKRVAFSKRVLDAIKPPATGETVVYDSKVAGLTYRLRASGAAAFYLYRKHEGRPLRHRLGDADELTVENARKAALARLHDMAQGINPNVKRRAKRKAMTFAELFDHYLEHHAKPKKKTWAEDEQKYRDYLTPLHHRRVADIRKADVQAIITKLGTGTGKAKGKPGAANRLAALVSAVFNVGIDDLELPIANPARGIRKFAERQRERFLNADELARFRKALEAEPVLFRDFFTLLLLTGARSGNVKAMAWEQVDLAERVWIIPGEQAKAGRQIVVPLAPQAVDILTRRLDSAKAKAKKRAESVNPWVFPSHRRDGKHPHLTEPKTAWARITTAAALEGVRIHDLRHTCATWQGKTGATLTTIGKSLGHSKPTTTAIYTQTELEQVRRSIEAAAQAMIGKDGAK